VIAGASHRQPFARARAKSHGSRRKVVRRHLKEAPEVRDRKFDACFRMPSASLDYADPVVGPLTLGQG
jgi:hypothetical protein